MASLVRAEVLGDEGRSDRAHVDPAVGVPPDLLVDRAGVQTGAAADAEERLAQLRVGQDLRTAVVEQDDVHLFRALSAFGALGTADDVDIHGLFLPRGAHRQQLEECREEVERRHQLFDPHHGDVDLRHPDAQACVALVFQDDAAPGIDDSEIDPRNPHVGGEELLPQLGPRDRQQLRRDLGVLHPELFVENAADVLARQVQRGRRQVRWDLVEELDDILAQVGFERLDPLVDQELVEVDLLRGQALGLDHRADVVPARDPEHDGARLGRVAGPVDLHPVVMAFRLEPDQVFVQALHDRALGRVSQFPEILPAGDDRDLFGPLRERRLGRLVDRVPDGIVLERLLDICFCL